MPRKSSRREMHGGSTSVITPAAYPQGAGWSDPDNLPGSGGRNVSGAGNHFSLNKSAGALPDPVDTSNPMQNGGGDCACTALSGGKKRKKSAKKRPTKRLVSVCKKKCTRKCYAGGKKKRKGRKSKKRNRKTKSRKARRGKKSRGKKGKGKKNRTRRRRMKGGGLFDDRNRLFQPATNIYRNSLFGAGEMVNQWAGKPAPFNPAPTVQGRLNPMGDVSLGKIPDVPAIHQAAGQAVANI
tara:strand:+ start:459 stop:1175 length:717 start_codon:yes stop_codon:yes gene_type:complete